VEKRLVLVKTQQAVGDFDKVAGLLGSERDMDAGYGIPSQYIFE
jgi:hypothetical protein